MLASALSTVTDASSQAAQKEKKKNTLTQEDFLNLFVTQMRYQNPLEPIDNNQMATQMVQFGSLEALNSMNKILGNIADYQASMNNLQGVGLIGKKVEAVGNGLSIENGKVSEGYYQLSKSGKATIQIYDAQGRLVRTIEAGSKDGSKQKLVWDGKNQQGVTQPNGVYFFQVTALDEKGQSIPVTSSLIDTVKSVSFENGIVYLNLGSRRITLSDILSIQS
ncbi:MAG: T9SS type A sorting domain-containing protein [Deltaproteobacteria bacterium]|nr:T9SS type A sorting domain-containing protein [Deltaproteobacteria bacterium]